MPQMSTLGLLLTLTVSVSLAEGPLVKLEVPSKFLPASRTIRIWLPASYHQETNRTYPVLYLHDGQNVFSSAGTNICFGWGNWALDTTVAELCRSKKMPEIIMVAIDNSPARYGEYCGRRNSIKTNGLSPFERYEAFLIQELKPRIDSEYRTKRDAANTAIVGSSLGGLCSVILAWEHPDVFGKAASLSGSFQVEQTNFLAKVLRPYTATAKPIRLYLDSGVIDFTGNDDGCSLTSAVAGELKRIGWNADLLRYLDAKPLDDAELEKSGLRRDKWSEARTSQHNEFYWRMRAWRAMIFLFPRETDRP